MKRKIKMLSLSLLGVVISAGTIVSDVEFRIEIYISLPKINLLE
ncbi:MAG: hypothetical protein ACTSO6_03225 [Promethearchaeota archaeon]